MWLNLPFFALLLSILSFDALANNATLASNKKRLARISAEIQAEKQKSAQINSRWQELQEKRSDLKGSIADVEKSLTKSRHELSVIKRKRTLLLNKRKELAQEISELRSKFGRRVRAWYKVHQSSFSTLPNLTSSQGIPLSILMKRIRKSDAELVRRLEAKRVEAANGLRETRVIMGQERSELERLRLNREELARLFQEIDHLEDRLATVRSIANRTIQRLRADLRAVERVVAAKMRVDRAEQIHSVVPMHGSNAPFIYPIKGSVSRRFGNYRLHGLDERVFHKGITLSVAPLNKVVASAPGRVVFVGELPNYGRLVIVDHGGRLYSLYGMLAKPLVKIQDRVDQTVVVGLTQSREREPENNNKNHGAIGGGVDFYFEIRRAGEPVDPILFIEEVRR